MHSAVRLTHCPRVAFLLATLMLLAGLILSSSARAEPGTGNSAPGELLVKFRGGIDNVKRQAFYDSIGASEVDALPQLQVRRIRVPDSALPRVKAALANHPQIEFVEENFLVQAATVPNDTGYAAQWHLPRIAAPQGWTLTTGSSNVVIAVIDSGIDQTHPDLAGKLLPGYNFVGANTDTRDLQGHGTAVAGAAAAITDNGTGIAGVAWDNPLMPLVVLDASGYGTYANMAAAITYAADHGARVLNLSLAGSSSSMTLQNAVNYAWSRGAVIVAAAANYATSTPYYPAACNNVVAVAATTSGDTLASFSNFGSWIDVAAPGASIYSTVNGGSYGYWSGTSFSAPITAGLVGLIWAANPALSNAEVVDILARSSDDLGEPGFDPTFGHGRINVYQALTLAKSYAPTVDSTAPTVAVTAPAAGATVAGTVTVGIAASDDVKVTRIELYLDGALAGSSGTSSAAFPWDTTAEANGWHTLDARAYDAAGNTGTATSVSVYVDNPATAFDTEPPVVTITSPAPGAQLGTRTTVRVAASDNVGVTRLELLVDGALKATSSTESLSWNWNTRKLKAGAHTLTAVAVDAAGNAVSDSLTVYK